jgi:hypothetical protein
MPSGHLLSVAMSTHNRLEQCDRAAVPDPNEREPVIWYERPPSVSSGLAVQLSGSGGTSAVTAPATSTVAPARPGLLHCTHHHSPAGPFGAAERQKGTR